MNQMFLTEKSNIIPELLNVSNLFLFRRKERETSETLRLRTPLILLRYEGLTFEQNKRLADIHGRIIRGGDLE